VRRAVGFAIIGFLVLCFAFYWLAYRPEAIRSECAVESSSRAYYAGTDQTIAKGSDRVIAQNNNFEAYYNLCVRSKGIPN